MKQQKFSFRKRLASFKFAWNGLRILLREEHNARIHLLAALAVLVAGFLFNLNTTEWIALVFAIALVLSLELVNSAIENLADFISPGQHHRIKKIKDLSAAAVLLAAMAALAIGLLVFIPKIAALVFPLSV